MKDYFFHETMSTIFFAISDLNIEIEREEED